MHNPPHPGQVLVEYLGGLSVADAAVKIGIEQEHLARLIDGQASIDRTLASKLGQAFGTSAELWAGMQSAYDNGLPITVVREIHASQQELAEGKILPYKFGRSNE